MKIDLKAAKLEHAQVLANLLNNKKIWQYLTDRVPFPYSVDDANNFIKMMANQKPQTYFNAFAGNDLIGACGIRLQECEYAHIGLLGYWVGEPYWGNGYATQMVKAMIEYGFNHLKLTKIRASIFENNPASMRVLKKCGFTKEAILPKGIKKQENYFDEHIFGILTKE